MLFQYLKSILHTSVVATSDKPQTSFHVIRNYFCWNGMHKISEPVYSEKHGQEDFILRGLGRVGKIFYFPVLCVLTPPPLFPPNWCPCLMWLDNLSSSQAYDINCQQVKLDWFDYKAKRVRLLAIISVLSVSICTNYWRQEESFQTEIPSILFDDFVIHDWHMNKSSMPELFLISQTHVSFADQTLCSNWCEMVAR